MKNLVLPTTYAVLSFSTLAIVASAAAAPASSHGPTQKVVRGMAYAWGAGISVRDEATTAAQDPTRLKSPLPTGSAPGPWMPMNQNPQIVVPDYSANALFGADAAFMEVDAHTTGLDQIPALIPGTGSPKVGGIFDNWLAYVTTVKERTLPGAGSSYIENRVQNGLPVGAELLSYYAQESENIDSALVGEVGLEATALSLGYSNTHAGTEDIDALDYALGVNTFGSGNASTVLFTGPVHFYYFSITPAAALAWTAAHPNAIGFAKAASGQWQPPRPGDIYCKKWSIGSGEWGTTTVYKDTEQLGIDLDEDVDALALSSFTIVFSTVMDLANPNAPQLRVSSGDGNSRQLTDLDDSGPVPVHTPVFDKIGLQTGRDDVDGLCGIDPEGKQHYDALAAINVTSTDKIASYPLASSEMMGMSLSRGVTTVNGPDSLLLNMSGWGGVAPSATNTVYLFLYTGSDPIFPNSDPTVQFWSSLGNLVTPTWTQIGPINRTLSQEDFSIAAPAGVFPSGDDFLAVYGVMYSPDAGQWSGSFVTQLGR